MRFPTIASGVAYLLPLLGWWLVLLNLMSPFPKPFSALISFAGISLLLLHGLELLVFNRRLQSSNRRWLDRLLVLVMGIFYLQVVLRRPVVPASVLNKA